jgi:hypothetical protein
MLAARLRRGGETGRAAGMRRLIAALLLFVLLVPLPGSQRSRPPEDRSGTLRARALPGVEPGLRVGALTLVEAWELTSPDGRFGGLSGLTLLGPRQFLAVSDTGQTLRFTLGEDGAVHDVRFADLPPLHRTMARKRYLDAEAVTRDPQSGTLWVALEGIGQIWRLSPDGRRQGRARNRAIARWPANGGTESLVRLTDRRFMALSERAVRAGFHEGVVFAGDPVKPRMPWFRFAYDSGDLGAPTDAAALPDGRALVLHRKLGLGPIFRSGLALVDPRSLTAGATLTAQPLARLEDRRLAENYEGLAVASDGAALSIWMLSDNNQQDWQRTRLLKFRLDPAALADSKKGGAAVGPP